MLGWDEITEGGTPDDAIVVGWRGTTHACAAAMKGHDVVMAPTSHTYFDNYQTEPATQPLAIGGLLTLQKVYEFEPRPPEPLPEKHHHVLGGQGQLWSEYIPTFEHLTYMAFPRACALSETLWCDKTVKNYSDFLPRIRDHQDLLLSYVSRIGPIPEISIISPQLNEPDKLSKSIS